MRPFSTVSRCKVPVALYHTVSNAYLPHVKNLYSYRSVSLFKNDLDFLARNYNFISLDTLLNHIAGNETLPGNPLLLTFDDGFREMYEIVMPLLLQKGLPATFFLISNSLDNKFLPYRNKISLILDKIVVPGNDSLQKSLSSFLNLNGFECSDIRKALLSLKYSNCQTIDELAEIAEVDFSQYLKNDKPFLDTVQVKEMIGQGFTTGAHSAEHPNFAELSDDQKLEQIVTSIRFLEEKEVLTHRAFAFPFHSNMISEEFYNNIVNSKEVEIILGTNGIVRNKQPRHYQRFHLDYNSGSIRKILLDYYAKGLIKDYLNLQK